MSLSTSISIISNFTLVVFPLTVMAKGRVSRCTYYMSKGPLIILG